MRVCTSTKLGNFEGRGANHKEHTKIKLFSLVLLFTARKEVGAGGEAFSFSILEEHPF